VRISSKTKTHVAEPPHSQLHRVSHFNPTEIVQIAFGSATNIKSPVFSYLTVRVLLKDIHFEKQNKMFLNIDHFFRIGIDEY
jgi:hypothetical protein